MNEHGLPHGQDPHPDREMSVVEMRDRLEREASLPEEDRLIVIDCREDDELAIARIDEPAGVRHIPMADIIQRHEDLKQDLPAGREQPLGIICRSGRRSLEVSLALTAMGFSNVRSVAGGILAWSNAIDPTVPKY